MAEQQDHTFYEEDGTPITIYGAGSYDEAVKAAEKVSADRQNAPRAPVTAGGAVKQAGAAGMSGISDWLGIPGTVEGWVNKGIANATGGIYRGVTGHDPAPGSYVDQVQQFGGIKSPVSSEALTSEMHREQPWTGRQPQNALEDFVNSAGRMTSQAIASGGLGLMNAMKYGVVPGVVSEGASKATKWAKDKLDLGSRPDWMPDWVPPAEDVARMGAAMLGPSVYEKGARAVTPGRFNQTTQDAMETFRLNKIPHTSGQAMDDPSVMAAEGATREGRQLTGAQGTQQQGFVNAILKRFGVDGTETTYDNMAKAGQNVGNLFKPLVANNSINMGLSGQQLFTDMGNVWNKYRGTVPKGNIMPDVAQIIRDVQTDMAKGTMSGPTYQNYVDRIRGNMKNANAQDTEALHGLRDALDNAMETNIAAFNPQDVGKWKTARARYWDLKATQDAVANSPPGTIDPNSLANAIKTRSSTSDFVQGDRELKRLADAGRILMKPLPVSEMRSTLNLVRGGTGAATGASIGHALAGPTGATVLGTLGAAPAVAQHLFDKAVMNPQVQSYLTNTIVKPGQVTGAGGLTGTMLRAYEANETSRPRRPGQDR